MYSRGNMSNVNPVDCLRLPVTVNKDGDSEIIQDMSNLKSQVSRFDTEQSVSEADEPETFTDKSFTSGSCSGSDSEVDESSFYDTEATLGSESEEASLSSLSESDESDESDPLAMSSEPQDSDDASLEPRSSIIVSSNMDLDSIDDNLNHGNDLVGSSDIVNLAEENHSNMPDEITEGFKRVQELVTKLMNVETTETSIEANCQFVKGLLKQLSFDSESDLDGSYDSSPIITNDQKRALVGTCGESKSVIKKVIKKEVWITKCETDLDTFSEIMSGNEQLDDNLESEDAVQFIPPLPSTIINSHPNPPKPNVSTRAKSAPSVKVVFCSRSPNLISMTSSAAIKTTMSPTSSTIHSDSFSSLVDASFGNISSKSALHPPPTCSKTTTTVSACSTAISGSVIGSVPAPAITTSVTPSGDKSKYELIREDIIAERNAQLKAMGFFEDFAELKSDMKQTKNFKMEKDFTRTPRKE